MSRLNTFREICCPFFHSKQNRKEEEKEIFYSGSISPTFVRQAKSCRRAAFGKKIDIQYHQHFALNLTKICHIIMPDL